MSEDGLFIGTPPSPSPERETEQGMNVLSDTAAYYHSATAPAPITGHGTAIGSRYTLLPRLPSGATIGQMSDLARLTGVPSGSGPGHYNTAGAAGSLDNTTHLPRDSNRGFILSGQQNRGSEEYTHIAGGHSKTVSTRTTATGNRKRKRSIAGTANTERDFDVSVPKKRTPLASEMNVSNTQGSPPNSNMPKQRQRAVSDKPHLVAK